MGLRVAAAILLSVAGLAAFAILPVMIGAIADAQGLDASQAGYVGAADLCGFALAAVAAVFWVGRLDARVAAGAGLMAALVGNFLSLGTPEFVVLLGARGIAGIGAGTAYAVALNVLSRSARAEQHFGIMAAAQIAYQVVALFALPRAVVAFGTDAIFLTLLGTAGIALLGVLPQSFASGGARRTDAPETRPRSGWLALAVAALFSLNVGALWTFIERIGVELGRTSAQIGTILSAALALSILGALGASAVGVRGGRIIPFVLAAVAQLVALALLTQHAGFAAFTAGAFIYSLAWAFAVPFLYIIVATEDPSGRLIVLTPAAQAIGTGLGAALGGSLITGTSYLPVNGLAAVALIGAVACATRLRQPQQSRKSL